MYDDEEVKEEEFNPLDIADENIDMTEGNDLFDDTDEMEGFHDVEEEDEEEHA